MQGDAVHEPRWRELETALAQYDVPVQSVANIGKGRYLVTGPTEWSEARITTPSSAAIRMFVGDYVSHRRFRAVQRLWMNMYDDRVVRMETGEVFYLTDAWQGRTLQVVPADIEKAAVCLARLHIAMEGVGEAWREVASEDVATSASRPRYGTWVRALKRGQEAFSAERLMSSTRNEEGSSSSIWQEWLPRWETTAQRAQEAMEKAGYDDLAKAASQREDMAWGQFQPQLLVTTSQEQLGVVQLTDPLWDDSLYDLCTLCQSIVATGHADGVKSALDTYRNHRPLSAEAAQVVIAYAAFPHEALRLVRQRHKNMESSDVSWQKSAELQYHSSERLLSLLGQRGDSP